MYSDAILEHFQNPQCVGAIEHADGSGQATGGEQCPEDVAHFWIRVVDGRIAEVRQRTRGCPVAIAASSMTAVLAQDKMVHDALQITEGQVSMLLGDMPERKLGSIVGPRALRAAVEDYLARQAG